MTGQKIELVAKTMLFMLDYFGDQDALGIVTFDTQVAVLEPLTMCDSVGKAKLKASIQKLRSGTQTNLSGGMLRGIELRREDPVCRASSWLGCTSAKEATSSGSVV